MRTPAGLRAQQTLDMLNSDWPIGPVGVGTLATRRHGQAGRGQHGSTLVGPTVHPERSRHQGRHGDTAADHVLRWAARYPDTYRRRHIGGRVRRHHASADDLLLARHRYRIGQDRRPLLVAGRQGQRRAMRSGRRYQYRAVTAVGVDLQAVCALCRGGCGQGRNGVLGRPADRHREGQGGRFRQWNCRWERIFRCEPPPRR